MDFIVVFAMFAPMNFISLFSLYVNIILTFFPFSLRNKKVGSDLRSELHFTPNAAFSLFFPLFPDFFKNFASRNFPYCEYLFVYSDTNSYSVCFFPIVFVYADLKKFREKPIENCKKFREGTLAFFQKTSPPCQFVN